MLFAVIFITQKIGLVDEEYLFTQQHTVYVLGICDTALSEQVK
jgi:hypothetical protein